MRRSLLLLAILLLPVTRLWAGDFTVDWTKQWHNLSGDPNCITLTPDGNLRVREAPGNTWWVGGQVLYNYRVTVKLRFLRADDRYSGFSLYLRQSGGWEKRSHYWVYLRPKARELYMQKVNAGQLDPDFQKLIKAERPRATPLNQWLTLKAEVNGRNIKVWLNDQLCLQATDTTDFPFLEGRLAFNVGLADVEIASIVQENLEHVEKLPVVSYQYLQKPSSGDPHATILTDGQTGRQAPQAVWQMLGPEPEIQFDLGGERFLDHVVLHAWAAPERNISSARLSGSLDGKQFHPLTEAINEETGRTKTNEVFSFGVRRIARYVRLRLTRPVQDVSIELNEVEFYGRRPTAADRRENAAPEGYVIGPPLPATTAAQREDSNYWYLAGPRGRLAVDKKHGLIAGVWNSRHDKLLERAVDTYHWETMQETKEADEYDDSVISAQRGPDGLTLQVRNSALPALRITKTYRLGTAGQWLKTIRLDTTSSADDIFVTVQTAGVLNQDFRRGSVYLGGDRGLGGRIFADAVTAPQRAWALGERNMHLVMSLRYDRGEGICQFRNLVDGRYARPVTSSWCEAANFPPTYTPNGWQMGLGTFHLLTGHPQSLQMQVVPFSGTETDFYRFYRQLPEVEKWYQRAGARPQWPRDLIASALVGTPQLTADSSDTLAGARRSLQMFDVGTLQLMRDIYGLWGDFPTQGLSIGPNGEQVQTAWVRKLFSELHDLSPRLKVGLYTWAWAANPESQVYQQHPDWFIREDKSGQVFNSYSNLRLNHCRLISAPGSMNQILGRFDDIMRTFNPDYFYLDGGGGGINMVDWQHKTLDLDPDWEEFHMRLREIVRKYGPEKAVFFNARSGPVFDLGYYEGIDQRLHQSTWRESADAMATIKIRQLFDPGQRVIPLYWRSDTLPYFSNYCVGLGICPAQYCGEQDQRLRLPYIEAAYETRNLQWTEADLTPDFRRDPRTRIEAFTLRRGGAAFIPVISHLPTAATTAVSADTRKLGLDPSRPVYVWLYRMRDIRQAKPAYPMSLTRQLYRDTGWALDDAARPKLLQIIERPGPRITVSCAFDPELLNMIVLTNSAVLAYSAGGRRNTFWLPEVMGVQVSGQVRRDAMQVRWQSTWPTAEALLCLPAGTAARGSGVREISLQGRRFALLTCRGKKGEQRVALRPQVSPGKIGGAQVPALQLASQAVAGKPLALQVKAAEFLTVWRDGVPVFATHLPAGQTATVALPPQLYPGDYQFIVTGSGGATASRTVQISSDFTPDLAPVGYPKGPPLQTTTKVNKTIRGLKVLQARTITSNGSTGGWPVIADPATLTIGGGTPDAPPTRYGYAFGGLELQDARVLDLRVTNTYHDAWALFPGRQAWNPQYDTVFMGLMVDYHTAKGYTKRVALSLGLIRTYRQTTRPPWGTGRAPNDFINLFDAISAGAESTLSIDLATWAPPGWDGRVWLTAGSDSVLPSRRLRVTITGAAASPAGRKITKGESLTQIETRRYEVIRTTTPPKIDGKLNDAVWAMAPRADKFRRLNAMSYSTQQTYAQVAYDSENLYVAYYCGETEKKQPVTSAKQIWNRDAIDLALDTNHDRHSFHQLIVDAAGNFAQFDHGVKQARDWPNVRHAVAKVPGGWAVELAIPFVSMGVKPPQAGEVWGVNFVRYRPGPPRQETLTWSPLPGMSLLVPDKFGELVFKG